MTTTINADNGVSSGSAGLKSSADSSGVLALQTNGTTAVTVGTDQSILMTGAPSIGGAGYGMGMGFRNRIINGAMVIDQRNAGASVTAATATYTWFTDRFKFYSTGASKISGQQVTSTTIGFTKSLKLTSLAATSPAAGDEYELYQSIEGFNTADIGWGTANAKTITLSFIVNSSLTGTFAGCLNNSNAGGTYTCYVFTYSVPTANTDTTISITVPGPTTGTWSVDNSVGIQIIWDLGSGSNYNTTAGAWATGFKTRTSGSVTFVGTNGATFYITGVQLEKGSTATAFDYRPYGTELALCQRYYARLNSGTSAYSGFGSGVAYSTTAGQFYIKYPVTMRSSPTLNGANLGFNDGAASTAITGFASSFLGTDSGTQQCSVASGLTQFRPYLLAANNSTSAYIDLSAEL